MALNGAFEFEDRLLETMDALCIRNSVNLEFQALTYNAIILLIEITV